MENRPLVKFIRNYIRDSSGVFSISSLVRISMTSFPAFTLLFVQINKLASVFYASVLLLMINFVITLSKCCRSTSRRRQKLIFKRRKEMQESMEGAIAAESEFHCCNTENHGLVN